MNNLSINILILMLMVLFNTFAQNNKPSRIYLTNYTFSPEKGVIGTVAIRPSGTTTINSVKVASENAGTFRISEGNLLSVKSERLKTGESTFDVTLVAKTLNGEIKETFRIVKDEFIRNKVIAHRGAWKNTGATENSIAALKHAIDLGCEGSEFDVHLSSDSIPVINHDAHIQEISIAQSPASELRKIKLSNGEPLPTLEEYLKAGIQQTKTKLILEIKPSELGKAHSIALTHKVINLVEKLQAQAWVDYISFDYDVCLEVMKIAPYAKVSYLTGDKSPQELLNDKFYGLDYHYSFFQKNPGLIKDAKEKNLTVNVWTVNEKEMLENLLKENVDFITTNEPELLLDIIAAKQ